MKQPALGLVASALVIVIALAFISLFPVGTFLGWVSFFMLGLIPMQVVAVVLWGGNPGFVSAMGQPTESAKYSPVKYPVYARMPIVATNSRVRLCSTALR